MSDPISKGGSRPPAGTTPQSETTSASEAKSTKKTAEPEKTTAGETTDPAKQAKASGELVSSKKLDLQFQSMKGKLNADLPKKETIADQKVATPKTTDLGTLPTKGNVDPDNILNQKTKIASDACTDTIATTCGVPETGDELCYTVSCGSKTDLGLLKQGPGTILDQKANIAAPACEGTLMSTCGVPDTDPTVCDTLSGCPSKTDLGSIRQRPGGTILDQKTNIAAPACEGTLMSTCGVPDTDPTVCDTLSGCPSKTDLGSIRQRPGGTILDQKPNIAAPACEGTLMSTCGVPDTDPTVCDTLSGCPSSLR